MCIDACAHGNTCIWQNAWLWQCNGTNPTHHYWVWEPDSNIIRSATTDSFQQNPEICLDMCTDTRYGNGACVVTANATVLNVGFRECTGASNQVRRRCCHASAAPPPPPLLLQTLGHPPAAAFVLTHCPASFGVQSHMTHCASR